MERRQEEFELLRARFGDVEWGPDLSWVLLKSFPLPVGWNRDATQLLIIVPPGYPTTPPDNFYVPEGLRLADGNTPNNYAEGQAVLGAQWGQFSFHSQVWNPAGEPSDGDSLLTFLLAASRRLCEGA